ncbi:MAG: hypothetical protein KC910_15865 [Candidatus Eremiobacteraeota bacterium]|nr:hypothetical protein [Candidatus Eremiobacteraeota bacterium]
MARFVKEVVLFLLLQLPLAGWVAYQYTPNEFAYFASVLDKTARLESLPSPKVVLVGGSNVAYGFDSELLEQRLGRPVVNMGIHAPFGLDYMLAEVESSLQPGDLVIVCPEYEVLASDLKPESLVWILELRPGNLAYVPLRQWPGLLDGGLPYLGSVLRGFRRSPDERRLRAQSMPVVARSAFDAWGDVAQHRNWTPPDPAAHLARIRSGLLFEEGYDTHRLQAAVATLKAFDQRYRARQAKMVLSLPPIPRFLYQRHPDQIATVESALRSTGIPVITTAEEMTFPADQFYDTIYHLRGPAIEARSQKVVRGLVGR